MADRYQVREVVEVVDTKEGFVVYLAVLSADKEDRERQIAAAKYRRDAANVVSQLAVSVEKENG